MNYVDIEQRLIDSIFNTYDEQVEEPLFNIWRVSRNVDWVILLTDIKKNVAELMKAMGTDERLALARITSAAVLRIPELTEHALINQITSSICWKLDSPSNTDLLNQNLVVLPNNLFDDAPDMVILYMLSNMSSKRIER